MADGLQFGSRAAGVSTAQLSTNEIYPLEQAQTAYERMMSGKARFRVVLKVGE